MMRWGLLCLPWVLAAPKRELDWSQKHFRRGDRISGSGWWMGKHTSFRGRITKITRNRFGRYRYHLGEREVMLEDITTRPRAKRA